ncbi:MAG: hypothetical protein K940chlam9_00367 [Chlamydiae bacterium]|nr:hypothetical protein [Chlamydiota bacterium]
MPRQPSGGLVNLKPAFKSVGSSCCPQRYPLRENGRLIFAEHDLETVQKISRSLGETEVKENQEGISYSAHQVRNGVNLSQIQSLENNHAYLKLPGNTPITKLSLASKN